MSDLNREEIMHLLRRHVATFAQMLDPQNDVPDNVLAKGGGPENRGGLDRINELFAMLKDRPRPVYREREGGE